MNKTNATGYSMGYGYEGFQAAMDTIDPENAELGQLYKIDGEFFTLSRNKKELYFKKFELTY